MLGQLNHSEGLNMVALLKFSMRALAASVGMATLLASGASADDSAAKPEAGGWWDTVKFSGYVEGGGLANIERGRTASRINFGHLFTDRSDRLQLNQTSLTLERPIDAKTKYDFGFKLQGMYGTDARYTHFLGEFDRATSAREQFDVVEAFLLFHTPWLGEGGTDFKIGQYVTLEGAEVIDPRNNFFYSHSYIFNFGIPFKHTGVLATTHVNSVLDLYYGIDTGVNTTFGAGTGDTNNDVAFHGGVGFNLMNGDLTILATTHIGPELPERNALAIANAKTRYLNDVTIVWKVNKDLTLTTDLNYIRDDTAIFGPNGNSAAEGYGIAQYLAYILNDKLSFGVRGEVWRDAQGAFVTACPGNLDFVNSEIGRLNNCFGSTGPGNPGKGTTFTSLTLGANIKPTVSKQFEGLTLRPEVRWDHSSDVAAFNGGLKHDQVTLGADIVVPFALWH